MIYPDSLAEPGVALALLPGLPESADQALAERRSTERMDHARCRGMDLRQSRLLVCAQRKMIKTFPPVFGKSVPILEPLGRH
jgi:hypothetical protein